jgi:hypothetical protein
MMGSEQVNSISSSSNGSDGSINRIDNNQGNASGKGKSVGELPPHSPSWGLLVMAGAKAGSLVECREILETLADLKQQQRYANGTISPQPFNHLLSAYSGKKDLLAVGDVLAVMRRAGATPDMHTYSILVNGLAEGLLVGQVSSFLSATMQGEDATAGIEAVCRHILQSGAVPNSVVWRCVTKHFVAGRDYTGLERLAVLALSADPHIPYRPLSSTVPTFAPVFSPNGDPATSAAAWQEAREEIWRSLVGAAGQLGRWEDAFRVVRELEQAIEDHKQLDKVDGGHHQVVVGGRVRHTCWQRAVRAATSSNGQMPWRRALLILAEMRSNTSNKGPTLTIWRQVVSACADQGTLEEVVELLLRMRTLDGHFPDDDMWKSIVDALANRGWPRCCSMPYCILNTF